MSLNSSNTATIKHFQSETEAIREAPEPIGARIAVWLLAGLIVSAVGATCLISVDRTVSSTGGKIVSTESADVFQALDPSIIKSIDVNEGQQVSKGQLLGTLDQTFAQADVTQLRLQIASLDAQIARGEAELKGVTPVFPAMADPDHARYAALQAELFKQRAAQYKAQMASYDEKAKQTEATIVKLQGDENRYSEREKIAKQVETMRSVLLEKAAGSLLNLLSATDQRLEMLRTMENGHNALIEAQHQLSSINADRDAFKEQWFGQVSQDVVTARNSRDTAVASLAKAAKHQDLVRITAAEDSVVLTVAKLSVGSVLKEGDALFTLMPLRAPMEAEIKLASRDVGFIRAGDAVTLKIDAFNYFEHGTAEGKILWISEGAFTTDDNGNAQPQSAEPYYKARVSLDKLNFTGVPSNFRFIPGMTLNADIKVGTRSLARYIIGGALRGVGESMREP